MIVPPYFEVYTKFSTPDQLITELNKQLENLPIYLRTIPPDKWEYRYEAAKWDIKEIIQHIIDNERIFAYRALRISRNDKTEMAGYEHNDYVPVSKATHRTPQSLTDEFIAVRKSVILLFKSFDKEMIGRTGTANGGTFDVEGTGMVIAGHLHHHLNVIKERYTE